MENPMTHPFKLLLPAAVALAVAATGCTSDGGTAERPPAASDDQAAGLDGNTLTVFSRDREIAEPLFQQFEQQTGITIRARWGEPVELAGHIIDEGTGSPADVFYGPYSDALGSLAVAGLLAPLSDAQLDRVPEAYRSADGSWAAVSGRAHAVFYNTDLLSEDDLPDTLEGFAEPAWRGRIAWDPTARSLLAAVNALGQITGEDAARAWLEGMRANDPKVFKGAPFGAREIVNVVAGGELAQVGFGSHYYLYDMQAGGEAANVAAKFYPGDPAGLLSVDGVGIINGTDNRAAAGDFVDFMLSQTAERYFASGNVEVPIVEGVQPGEGGLTAEQLTVPGLDIQQLAELDDTRELLRSVGITW
jgi:iron(III) transport system substrate-binding protein